MNGREILKVAINGTSALLLLLNLLTVNLIYIFLFCHTVKLIAISLFMFYSYLER